MNMKNTVRIRRFNVLWITLFVVFLSHSSVLNAKWFEDLTEEQQQAFREEIQDAIRMAQNLANEGKYADALRVLFDMLYKEQKSWVTPHSPSAGKEIISLEKSLLRDDPSPLMQWFRDPDVPLQEKREHISELRTLAEKKVQNGEKVLFRGKYHGTLVQLMISPKLSEEEKFDVLYWIESTIQKEYTSTAQRDRIREEIARLRKEADQKFHAQQYIEAFILIDEAMRKAHDIPLELREDDMGLIRQDVRMKKAFVHADESPLMQVFKDRQIPIRKRQVFLYALQEMLQNHSLSGTEKIILQGEVYTGTLAQILTHPQMAWMTKWNILESIEVEILQQEPDYVPEWKLGGDEEFLKLWEQYKKGNDMKNEE